MRRSVMAAAAAATALLVLSACAPRPVATPTARSAHSASATPTPTARATQTATPLPSDVLFQITATATAPGGAVARLTETVHAPLASTTSQAADEAQLDAQCDSWRTAFASTEFLVAEISTAVTSGSWNSDETVAVDMAGYPVWTGDQRPFQAYCASALPSIPGAARAVSPVGGGDADNGGGWAIYRYGFSIPSDPGADSTAGPDDITLSKCSIRMGAAAKDSIFASTWPGATQASGGLSCVFGGT